MPQYLATFIGRKVGAIGIRYRMQDIVTANTPEAAELKLYEKYDSIRGLRLHITDTPTTMGPSQEI